MSLKFTDTFEELKIKLSSLGSDWDESQNNKKVFKRGAGLLNWFPTTGSINFQGKEPDKSDLERAVLEVLYPQEANSLIEQSLEQKTEVILIDKENTSLERKYLTSGINEGELIIGIVSAVGTETNRVSNPLKDRLRGFGYDVEEIRVSSILPKLVPETKNEYERIKHYMNVGDKLREESSNNAILAAGVAQEISKKRGDSSKPCKKAYIIISLKHPSEVEYLRKIYADGFYLIGI